LDFPPCASVVLKTDHLSTFVEVLKVLKNIPGRKKMEVWIENTKAIRLFPQEMENIKSTSDVLIHLTKNGNNNYS
jgi:hypothetical protein